MTWVLILVVYVNGIGGTVTMHDFDSHNACKVAIEATHKMLGETTLIGVTCVPKGDIHP